MELFTKAEIKATLLCEICGTTAPAAEWLKGWKNTGRSRLRGRSDVKNPVVNACFCPKHEYPFREWVNPMKSEVLRLAKLAGGI